MKRLGTRKGDGEYQTVERRLLTLPNVGVLVGWLAFAVAAVKCVLSIPHP